jgi:2-amino-4-hydroxy-6-hydroxymethyldihydropteridine diphosphokinase
MEVNKVFLSLGSNLGDRKVFLETALSKLSSKGEIEKCSRIYETPPWGFQTEEHFLNICVIFRTHLSPTELLKLISEIETEMGRQRNSEGYSSRTIDIDIIFFNDLIHEDKNLRIPHPLYHLRSFVLNPLIDLDDQLIDPASGKLCSEFKEVLENQQESIILSDTIKY